MAVADETPQRLHFERAHERRDDPWGVTSRWYEIRKRGVLLASLPSERYGSTLEVGCSIGVLTEALSARSDRVLALDFADSAVQAARRRLAGDPAVAVEQSDIRDGLPDGPWDLVVLSEVGYYLDVPQLIELLTAVEEGLSDTGILIACHWRHPEPDFLQTGDGVHRVLSFETVLERLVHHEEADFVLDVFGMDGRSVAQRDGLA